MAVTWGLTLGQERPSLRHLAFCAHFIGHHWLALTNKLWARYKGESDIGGTPLRRCRRSGPPATPPPITSPTRVSFALPPCPFHKRPERLGLIGRPGRPWARGPAHVLGRGGAGERADRQSAPSPHRLLLLRLPRSPFLPPSLTHPHPPFPALPQEGRANRSLSFSPTSGGWQSVRDTAHGRPAPPPK